MHQPQQPKISSLLRDLLQLWAQLPARRRWQLHLVILMMLGGALAEVMTLGAVLPFLVLMAAPERAPAFPWLMSLLAQLGWQDVRDFVTPAAILFATTALAAGAFRLALVYVGYQVIHRVGFDIGTEAYRRTLCQPYTYHLARNSSEAIALITKTECLTWGILQPLLHILMGLVIAICIIIALIAIDPIAATTTAGGFGLAYLGVSWVTRDRLRTHGATVAQGQTLRVQTAQEGLGGIRDMLLDRAQAVYVEKFSRTNLAVHQAYAASTFIAASPRFVIEACGMAMIAVIALVLSRGTNGLASALPVLGALALGAQRLLPLMQQIYFGWVTITSNRQMLADVLQVLALPIASLPAPTTSPLAFEREVVFRNVSFRYAADLPWVLDGMNMRIAKGERVALVGRTGSGKSTVMDLFLGLLEPSQGTIQVDETVLDSHHLGAWQANIAHVPQAIYLADASIAENIALGVEPELIDRGRMVEAANRAAVAEFVASQANGYDTIVGERGIRLSGGQRQRIGIARALYRRAKVLVLDEATSALDGETEATVMDAIRGLDRELTILIIAHRLTTVALCSRVLRVENGQVVEDQVARQEQSQLTAEDVSTQLQRDRDPPPRAHLNEQRSS
jgi:ABC-type multidrug transport system fused ATPase/permease subunit